MYRVKSSSLLLSQPHRLNSHNRETRFVNAGEDFPLLAAAHGIRLDDRECTFK
jgi:hypothetical protein